MKRVFRNLVAFVLVLSIIITSHISSFAAAEEVYISDLRIIYADSYSEAKEILSETAFKNYKLLNENLNDGTKEIGVWLAYDTTTDIEDAITDLAIMQMNGGYQSGNFQEMIKASLEEYEKMGEKYETVIDYFSTAYDDDYFLAKLAYRQLNLYNVETIGISTKPTFEGELLGDIFYEGIDSKELAIMFMEGNKYALNNIRSLLAMGASYNEDGLTYLEKVGEAAKEMNDDPEIYDGEDYDDIAKNMVITLTTIRDMIKELEAYEDELNFNDEEVTDEELKYVEHKALANMLRDVEYLDGKTLYEFVKNYDGNKSDYSKLYPLVAALNEGQTALVELICYYDVIRYSMASFPEEYLEKEVAALEKKYEDDPFNVYEGVDRTVYKGTFALTSAAYRADAYNEEKTLADAFFGHPLSIILTATEITVGAGGLGLMIWGAFERKAENAAANTPPDVLIANAKAAFQAKKEAALNSVASSKVLYVTKFKCGDMMDTLMGKYFAETDISGMTFANKVEYFMQNRAEVTLNGTDQMYFNDIENQYIGAKLNFDRTNPSSTNYVNEQVQNATAAAQSGGMAISTMLFLVGGMMLLASAFTLGYTAYSYYHPSYRDIPVALVDMIETDHGDRYIKYDVVYEAEAKENGSYAAGDLNAFEAQRWNALYYTKSYEAGKALLADEFILSTTNNKAKDGYTPVHRFGELICYDLNKYNFSDKAPSIYLSVKQSKHDKAAVEDVPQVVGSIFANGIWALIGGIGALVGVGGTLGTQALLKKKNTKDQE